MSDATIGVCARCDGQGVVSGEHGYGCGPTCDRQHPVACPACRGTGSDGAYVIKLVRDGYRDATVPGLFFGPVGGVNEHVQLLRQKLIEEVGEYLANPSITELADVYAVLQALAVVDLGSTPEDVGGVALSKQQDRGGFYEGVVMRGPRIVGLSGGTAA